MKWDGTRFGCRSRSGVVVQLHVDKRINDSLKRWGCASGVEELVLRFNWILRTAYLFPRKKRKGKYVHIASIHRSSTSVYVLQLFTRLVPVIMKGICHFQIPERLYTLAAKI
jgi:hypothetical protein